MMYAVNKNSREHRVVKSLSQESYYAASQDWELLDADDAGWIPWQGGACPLPDGDLCEFKCRDNPGSWSRNGVNLLEWSHKGVGADIVAYRPILDTKPEAGIDITRIVTERKAPEWDGDRPPAGSLCEMRMTSGEWEPVKIEAYGREHVIFSDMASHERVEYLRAFEFRPIRSEEDRSVHAMENAAGALSEFECRAIYNAIRDGKIPGVKLAGAD